MEAIKSAGELLQTLLPAEFYESVLSDRRDMEELRLRRNGYASVVRDGKQHPLPYFTNDAAFEALFDRLCRHSRYAQEALLCKGYFLYPGGCRIGISGQAAVNGKQVCGIRRIDSMCLRFPHRCPGIAAPLVGLFLSQGENGLPPGEGMLIFAPPGEGKTTVLRDLCEQLASPPHSYRVAVMDEREELFFGRTTDLNLDIYAGWPKTAAMEAAIRSGNPQILVCDEIGSEEEAEALLGVGGGVPLLVSVHGASVAELSVRKHLRRLLQSGRFFCAVRLHRGKNGSMGYSYTPLVGTAGALFAAGEG